MIRLNIDWQPEPEPMAQPVYVEADNGIRFDLNENDLKDIGAFTRQNVERCLIGG